MHRIILSALTVLSIIGCVKSKGNPYYYQKKCPVELFQRFIDGDPIDKVGASRMFVYYGCKEAVPVILNELKTLYASYHCIPPIPPSGIAHDHNTKCYVEWRGRRVPYIDYHTPLFGALSRLTGIQYFEPDEAWYQAIERWIAENLEEK
jgi:hypothetical protein